MFYVLTSFYVKTGGVLHDKVSLKKPR